MTFNYIDGDVLLILDEDGIDINVENSRIEMTTGLDNYVLYCLLVDEEPVHFNVLQKSEINKFKSNYTKACRRAINLNTLNDISTAIKSDLKQLIDLKYAKDITINTINTVDNIIESTILIKLTDNTIKKYIIYNRV